MTIISRQLWRRERGTWCQATMLSSTMVPTLQRFYHHDYHHHDIIITIITMTLSLRSSPWHYHHHHHDIIIIIIMTLSWSFFRQAGFSTEDSPQCIIPTVVGRGRHKGAMEVSWQCWLIWNIRLHKGDGDKTEKLKIILITVCRHLDSRTPMLEAQLR